MWLWFGSVLVHDVNNRLYGMTFRAIKEDRSMCQHYYIIGACVNIIVEKVHLIFNF